MRHGTNKKASIRRFNKGRRRSRGENRAIMRGGWRL